MKRQEQIRKEILLQAYAARPLALTVPRITRDSRKQGYDYGPQEIAQELDFLAEEKLLTLVPSAGSTELHYKISGEGVRNYEQHFAA